MPYYDEIHRKLIESYKIVDKNEQLERYRKGQIEKLQDILDNSEFYDGKNKTLLDANETMRIKEKIKDFIEKMKTANTELQMLNLSSNFTDFLGNSGIVRSETPTETNKRLRFYDTFDKIKQPTLARYIHY